MNAPAQKTMKVKTVRGVRIAGEEVEAGKTLTVPHELGAQLVHDGKAVKVADKADKAPAPSPSPAPQA